MGEIHELLVLALPFVWFAGPTPEGWGWKNDPEKRLAAAVPLQNLFKFLPILVSRAVGSLG